MCSWRFALSLGMALFGCSPDTDLHAGEPSDSSIVVSPDAGFRLPSFACDGSPSDHDAMELPDAPRESGGCVGQNANVRFQTHVLPLLQRCSGELCRTPRAYQ